MYKGDEIARATACDGLLRAIAVSSRDMVERARNIHMTLPVVTAALGRALSAASMMGNMLKEDDATLTMHFRGGGPMGNMTVVSDSKGNTRGYVQNPMIDLPLRDDGKLDVGQAVGRNGDLTVIKDMNLKEPYIGSVPILSGEIAEDIALYFAESEQIPSACALGVLIDRDQSVLASGGYILQLMPGADEQLIHVLEKNINGTGAITEVLKQGKSATDLLEKVLEGLEPHIFEPEKVEYRCYCSRERVERALMSVGVNELRDMLEQDGKVEITCQFCDKIYNFDKDDLEGLIKSAKN